MNLNFSKQFFSILGSLVLVASFIPGVSTYAASTPISSASASYNLDLTACRLSFNWTQFISDLQTAGATKNAQGFSSIPSSNPYIDQGCVSQTNLFVNGALTKAKYADFKVGPTLAKNSFGNDPVLGITSQAIGTYSDAGAALNAGTTYNRTLAQNLPTAFANSSINGVPYLDRAYNSNPAMKSTATGTKNYYLPRPFWGGVDQFVNNVYYGGPCTISNGQISVRENYAGQPVTSVDWSGAGVTIDPANPTSTCARRYLNGVTTLENRSLKTFQYIFEKTYPTTTQCTALESAYNAIKTQSFPNGISFGSEGCDAFYRRTLGANLTGSRTGTKILAVTTFYSMYDDGSAPQLSGTNLTLFNWLGWVNPDVGGPRQSDSRGLVRGYDGYSTFVL